ncbi:Retrovirus-related Pol polyprotein from transposon TNT 1-94 [Trichinella pseudospiralis]|uniref:Retrovirus-related Pol polyprotein from transposon TNT 1-94 n=1 Tax=Trichinella pseudospiralis TaxID=6337 RepID=A0A0V0XIF3_TRIPS|nr:Retrovirus-related Pol polyprotein from transposon TNT 1-94 [Trichinella pseudospiralis]
MSHSKNGKRNQFVDGSWDEAPKEILLLLQMTLKTDLYEKNEEEDGSNTKTKQKEQNSEQAPPFAKQKEAALGSKQIDKRHWKRNSLEENFMWTLIDPLSGKNILECRWVLRIKVSTNGSVARYKARQIAASFMRRSGIDYDETCSPVDCFDTVQAYLSIVTVECLKLQQLDVMIAFLYGGLKEEVYLKQPEGFENRTNQDYQTTRLRLQ